VCAYLEINEQLEEPFAEFDLVLVDVTNLWDAFENVKEPAHELPQKDVGLLRNRLRWVTQG